MPFIWTILLFLLTFLGLALLVFPYIIPTGITIYQAAADPSSMVIMFNLKHHRTYLVHSR